MPGFLVATVVAVCLGQGPTAIAQNAQPAPAAAVAVNEVRQVVTDARKAEQADGLRHENTQLGVGMPAPAISGRPRNARRAITLDSFRGKPIVLVFWGTG